MGKIKKYIFTFFKKNDVKSRRIPFRRFIQVCSARPGLRFLFFSTFVGRSWIEDSFTLVWFGYKIDKYICAHKQKSGNQLSKIFSLPKSKINNILFSECVRFTIPNGLFFHFFLRSLLTAAAALWLLDEEIMFAEVNEFRVQREIVPKPKSRAGSRLLQPSSVRSKGR